MNRRMLALGAVLAGSFLGELAFALLLLPLLQLYLPGVRHLSVALPGYLLAAYGLARLVSQVPLGALADAIDHRLAFGLGYLAVLAAGLGMWPPVSPAVLLLAAVLFGLGHSLADPLVPDLLAAGTGSDSHGRVFSYLGLAQVGGLVIGVAGGAFVVDLAPVSTGFLLVTGANLLAMLLLVGTAGYLRDGAGPSLGALGALTSGRGALIEERMLYLFGVFFAVALAANLLTPDLSPFITQRLHTSLHVMTLYLVPAGLAGVLALPLGGWLTDRFGRLPPLLGGAAAAALAFAMLTHLNRPWQASVAAIFGVAGLALTVPAATAALVDEAPPGHRGLSFGGMMAVQGLAEAVGPFVGGILIAVGGAAVPFAAAAVAIWLAIPLSVLYASAPRDGLPGVVVGYTPFTRTLSRMSIRAHAWYLAKSGVTENVNSAVVDRGLRDQ